MSEDDKQEIYDDFREAVNMQPKEIEDWLDTEDSKRVGQKDGGGESVGHKSGRRIVEIKRTNKADLTESDYEHMRKVVGYVHRHRAQGPDSDVKESDWRFSLMNWGYDPCKEQDC
jgi:hypothetical protein